MTTTRFVLEAVWVAHILFHLVGTFGVMWGLVHSYKVHKPSSWKITATVFWAFISVAILIGSWEELLGRDEITCEEKAQCLEQT